MTEEPTKRGIILKKGALVHKWKKRFFVLESSKGILTYYKKEGDKEPSGKIYLTSTLSVSNFEGKDPKLYRFNLKVEDMGNKQSLDLAVESEGDRAEWAGAITSATKYELDQNKGGNSLKPPSGGYGRRSSFNDTARKTPNRFSMMLMGKGHGESLSVDSGISNKRASTAPDLTHLRQMIEDYNKPKKEVDNSKVFGVSLDIVMDRQGRDIPTCVKTCVEYLRENALEQEGLFRISGNNISIQDLKEKLNTDDEIEITSLPEPLRHVNAVAGALKLYFRELPDPIISADLFDDLMVAYKTDQPVVKMKEVLLRLPERNLNLLKYVLLLLLETAKNAEKTKMTLSNLAVCLGPSMLKPKKISVETVYEHASFQSNALKKIMENLDVILGDNNSIESRETDKTAADQPTE